MNKDIRIRIEPVDGVEDSYLIKILRSVNILNVVAFHEELHSFKGNGDEITGYLVACMNIYELQPCQIIDLTAEMFTT